MIGIGRCPIIDNLMPVTPATATARAAFGISPMDTIHIGQNPLNYVPPRMQIGHESSIPILSSADKSQPFRPTNRFSPYRGQYAKTPVQLSAAIFLSPIFLSQLPAFCLRLFAFTVTPPSVIPARKTQLVQQHASFCNLHPAFFTLQFTHACPFQLALPTTPAN